MFSYHQGLWPDVWLSIAQVVFSSKWVNIVMTGITLTFNIVVRIQSPISIHALICGNYRRSGRQNYIFDRRRFCPGNDSLEDLLCLSNR